MPVAALHAVSVNADPVRYERYEVIAARGTAADAAFLLVAGRVEVFRPGPGGQDECLGVLVPGALFGHVELLEDEPRSTTWIAKVPCRVLRFPREAFRSLVADRTLAGSTMRRALIIALSNQLQGANRRLARYYAAHPTDAGEGGPSDLLQELVDIILGYR
jgi:CRP-like cAMP-binding protein